MKTFNRMFTDGFVQDMKELSQICDDNETDNLSICIEDDVIKKKLAIHITFELEELK